MKRRFSLRAPKDAARSAFGSLTRCADTAKLAVARSVLGVGTVPGRTNPPIESGEALATPLITSFPAPGVLKIHLGGGRRRNVLGRALIDRIDDLVSFPPADTKVVLLTADGPDFCAGYDLVEAARGGAESLIANDGNFASLRRSNRPVIAVLHGNVIGGGLELALAADVRIASADTRFAIPASRLGLIYSETGVRMLVDEVGESTARAMLLAGRVLAASEALVLGLVSEVVPRDQLEATALELAVNVASWPPIATSGNRRVLDVVTGRIADDTAALRLGSFAPGGALGSSIAAFVRPRTNDSATTHPPHQSLLRSAGGRWRDGERWVLHHLRPPHPTWIVHSRATARKAT